LNVAIIFIIVRQVGANGDEFHFVLWAAAFPSQAALVRPTHSEGSGT
jgi:hypothetical protein